MFWQICYEPNVISICQGFCFWIMFLLVMGTFENLIHEKNKQQRGQNTALPYVSGDVKPDLFSRQRTDCTFACGVHVFLSLFHDLMVCYNLEVSVLSIVSFLLLCQMLFLDQEMLSILVLQIPYDFSEIIFKANMRSVVSLFGLKPCCHSTSFLSTMLLGLLSSTLSYIFVIWDKSEIPLQLPHSSKSPFL